MTSLLRHVRSRSVSYLALCLSLVVTGTAYAAVTVTGQAVVDGTLSGADVGIGALPANVLQASAVSSAARGRRGPRGPRGFAGPAGIQGVPGASGANGSAGSFGLLTVPVSVMNAADTDDTSPDVVTVEASCPTGLNAIGGGAKLVAVDGSGTAYDSPLVHIREMYRSSPATGVSAWRAIAVEELGGLDDQWTLTSYAVCGRMG